MKTLKSIDILLFPIIFKFLSKTKKDTQEMTLECFETLI